jgi:hypothetical protein
MFINSMNHAPSGGQGGHQKKCSGWACGLLVLCLFLPSLLHAAEKDTPRETVAVFSFQESGLQFNALTQKTVQTVMDTFDRLGRFQPVDAALVQRTFENIPEGSANEQVLLKAAEQLNADLYVLVTVSAMGNYIIGTLSVNPVSNYYKDMKKNITVRSMVFMNIPLKLAREVALLHRGLPVHAQVLEKRDGLYLLNAGQWNGLAPGRFRTDRSVSITIHNTGRYQSLASLPAPLSKATRFAIMKYPSIRGVLGELDDRIDYNTNYKYSLATAAGGQNLDPEKQFTASMCLNLAANACIPGYGSFLSTTYLGFKKTTPSIPGIVFTSLLIVTHFILPECMTKFKINFFPGVMDKDKTADMNHLQIFLWSTLPLTVSVAFMDQLAHQLTTNNVLPPFFMKKDETALVLSIFIPGGGLFYKGHRLPGWGFHLSEMFLAGFCVYTKNEKKKVMWGGITLGGVKFIELMTAFLCKPAYVFFNLEKEGQVQQASLSMDVHPTETGDLMYRLGLSYNY